MNFDPTSAVEFDSDSAVEFDAGSAVEFDFESAVPVEDEPKRPAPKASARDPMLRDDYVEAQRQRFAEIPEAQRITALREAAKKTNVEGRAARALLAEAEQLNAAGRQQEIDNPLFTKALKGAKGGGGAGGKVQFPENRPTFGEIMDFVPVEEVVENRKAGVSMAKSESSAQGVADRFKNRAGADALERSWTEAAADTGVALAKGGNSLMSLPVALLAPGGDAYNWLKENGETIASLESDTLKAKREQQAELIKLQPDELGKFAVSLWTSITDPSIGFSTAVEQLPIMGALLATGGVGAIVGRAALTPAGAAAASVGARFGGNLAMAGGGAALAGGDAAGDTFDRLMDKKATPDAVLATNPDYAAMRAKGMSADDARRAIAESKSKLAAAMAAPLGAISGLVGLKAPGTQALKLGRAGYAPAARAGAIEMAGEIGEEVATKGSSNIAVGTVDPRQRLTEGFGEAAAGAVIGSAGPSVAAGFQKARESGENAFADALRQDVAGRDFLPGPVDEFARRSMSPSFFDPGAVVPGMPVPGAGPVRVEDMPASRVLTPEELAAEEIIGAATRPAVNGVEPVPPAAGSASSTAAPASGSTPPIGVAAVPQGSLADRAKVANDGQPSAPEMGAAAVGAAGAPDAGGSVGAAGRAAAAPKGDVAGPAPTAGAKAAPVQPAAGPAQAGVSIASLRTRYAKKRQDLIVSARNLEVTGSPELTARAKSLRLEASRLPQMQEPEQGEALDQFNTLADSMERVFGLRPSAYSDSSPAAVDGFQDDEIGGVFVNISQPEMPVVSTVFHEFKHQVRTMAEQGNASAKKAEELLGTVWDMISPEGKRTYAEKYLFKAQLKSNKSLTVDQVMADPKALGLLKEEMLADFMGKRATDRRFLKKLAQREPETFGEFVKQWLEVLTKLIADLKGDGNAGVKNVDQFIAKLEEAKRVAEDAMVEWSRAKAPAEPVAKPEPTIRKSARSERELGAFDPFAEVNEEGELITDEDYKGKDEEPDIPDWAYDAGIETEIIVADDMMSSIADPVIPDWAFAEEQQPVRDAIEKALILERLNIDNPDAELSDNDLAQKYGNWTDEQIEDAVEVAVAEHGHMPEQGLPKLVFRERKKGTYEASGIDGRKYIVTGDGNLFRAYVRGKDGVVDDWQSMDINDARVWLNNSHTGALLRKSGFDLAKAVPPEVSKAIIKQWKELAAKDGAFSLPTPGRDGKPKTIVEEMGIEGVKVNDAYGNLEVDFVGTDETATVEYEGRDIYHANTILFKPGSKAGSVFYPLVFMWARNNRKVLRADATLSYINAFRRTEQMLSAGLRSMETQFMWPGVQQRVFGWDKYPQKDAANEANIVRLALATHRNFREMVDLPESVTFDPKTGKFSDKEAVKEALSAKLSRRAGFGPSTAARALITEGIIEDAGGVLAAEETEGDVAKVEDAAGIGKESSLLYSGRVYTSKAGRIRRTVASMIEAAESMVAWKDWYKRHEQALEEMFGEDKPLFEKLLAATSQASTVATNVALALKAYRQYYANQPFEGYLPAVASNLRRIRAEDDVRGAKISEYDKANAGDPEGIAVDRHIAEFMFNTGRPNARQIRAASRRIREIASRLGWEPREVQSALWAYNQVRKGKNPVEVQSYDTLLQKRAEEVSIATGLAEDAKARSGGVRGPAVTGSSGKGLQSVRDRARTRDAEEVGYEAIEAASIELVGDSSLSFSGKQATLDAMASLPKGISVTWDAKDKVFKVFKAGQPGVLAQGKKVVDAVAVYKKTGGKTVEPEQFKSMDAPGAQDSLNSYVHAAMQEEQNEDEKLVAGGTKAALKELSDKGLKHVWNEEGKVWVIFKPGKWGALATGKKLVDAVNNYLNGVMPVNPPKKPGGPAKAAPAMDADLDLDGQLSYPPKAPPQIVTLGDAQKALNKNADGFSWEQDKLQLTVKKSGHPDAVLWETSLVKAANEYFKSPHASLVPTGALQSAGDGVSLAENPNFKQSLIESYKPGNGAKYGQDALLGFSAYSTLKAPDSKTFKQWFGKSKIVNPDGTPRLMFHGTGQTFYIFKGKQADAFFLSPKASFATSFANMSASWMQGHGMGDKINKKIMSMWVKAERPWDYDNGAHIDAVMMQIEKLDFGHVKASIGSGTYAKYVSDKAAVREYLREGNWPVIESGVIQDIIRNKLGHDSFYVTEGGAKNLAVYGKDQVKLALLNVGAFGEREITKKEAELFGLSKDEANKLQAEGDMRFSARQTETPEFKRWFDDSKVVDAEGMPLVVYHGTAAKDFTAFDMSKSMDGGMFFTADPSHASRFADHRDTGNRIMPVYLAIKNPLVVDGKRVPMNHDSEHIEALVERASKRGHDGIIIRNFRDYSKIAQDTFVAFSPEQIKSAIGNDGTFDANDPSILSSARTGQYKLRDFGLGGRTVEQIQDRYNRWKQAVEDIRAQGGSISEDNDFYRAEERYWGRVGAQIEDFKTEFEDWVKQVQKDGLDLITVAEYAYAEHAKDRNAMIAARRASMPDGGSGMTNQEADDILDEARQSGLEAALQRHSAQLRTWTQGTRDVMFNNGLISQDEYDSWTNNMPSYVPLRGLPPDSDLLAEMGSGTGKGFNIRGKESKRATGRRSRAKQIIEHIVADRTKSLIRSGKNEVLRHFLKFVLDNPSPNLWEVEAVETKPITRIDANGDIVIEEDQRIVSDKRAVTVKDGGREIHITVRDEVLRNQLQNLNVENLHWVVGSMLFVNRILSRLYTSLNPVFALVTNPVRDVQTATFGAIDELGFLGAGRMWLNMAPAFMESFAAEAGKRSADYTEFRNAGGKTAFFDFKTIDDQTREMMNLSKQAERSLINPIKLGPKTLHFIESLSTGFENMSRLAAYKAARQMGRSVAESAHISKNLTVNFNRKGALTPYLSAWFLFFNPAVQGTTRMLEALKSPKVLATLGAAMTGMAALALRNAGAGEDDDGVPWWDKIPDEVKERNMIFVLPPGASEGEQIPGSKVGRYIKVPMPYGYNFFAVVANMVVDVWRNAQDPRHGRDTISAMKTSFGAFMGSWVPVAEVGGSFENPKSMALVMTPDAINPIMQNVLNVNPFGRTLHPESPNTRYAPDSTKYFAGQAGTLFQRAAEGLNAATGGTKYEPGLIDMSPAQIENLVRGYLGGPAQFTMDIANTFYARYSLERPVPDIRRLPFAKQLFGVIDDETDRMLSYSRMDKVDEKVSRIKAAMKDRNPEAVAEMNEDYGALAALGGVLKNTKEQLAELRKRELAIVTNDKLSDGDKLAQLQTLNGMRRKTLQMFNSAYGSALVREKLQEEELRLLREAEPEEPR